MRQLKIQFFVLMIMTAALCVQSAIAQQPSYFTRVFDNSNAAPQVGGAQAETQGHGVNDSGVVVGMFGDSNDTFHAFE